MLVRHPELVTAFTWPELVDLRPGPPAWRIDSVIREERWHRLLEDDA